MAFNLRHFNLGNDYAASVEADFINEFKVDNYTSKVKAEFIFPLQNTIQKKTATTKKATNATFRGAKTNKRQIMEGKNALLTHTNMYLVMHLLEPILAPFHFRHWLSSSGTGTPTFPNWHRAKMGHPLLELDDPVPELGST
jgi:hypothetical protein